MNNLEILGYSSPFDERLSEADKELERLTDLLQTVEIPTNPQTKKDYQAKIQAKMLYNEINTDLRHAISAHNQLINDAKEHREAFLKEADGAFRAINTVPEVNYGAKYGVVGMSKEDYENMLFEPNIAKIDEYFEVFSSEIGEDLKGADLQIKRDFDIRRGIVQNFIQTYSIDRDNLMAFVQATLDTIAEEDRERQESITRAIQEQTPDRQRLSRLYTGDFDVQPDEDGFIDYGLSGVGSL